MDFKTAAFVISCCLFVGCAGNGYRAVNRYDGERSVNEVAVFKVGQSTDVRKDLAVAYRGLEVISVDDIKAGNRSINLDYINEIWLPPGRHTVTLKYLRNGAHANANLWFIAEAGKTYIGKYDAQRFSIRIWIEEEKSKRGVGGIVGSEDEPK